MVVPKQGGRGTDNIAKQMLTKVMDSQSLMTWIKLTSMYSWGVRTICSHTHI